MASIFVCMMRFPLFFFNLQGLPQGKPLFPYLVDAVPVDEGDFHTASSSRFSSIYACPDEV
jgi:hypothetical protein